MMINTISAQYRNSSKQFHRLDGPAVILSDGSEFWYFNNKLHREDGPAFQVNGYQEWYINGKLHRMDGPARIWSNGEQQWYMNGKDISDDIVIWMKRNNIPSDYTQWTDINHLLFRLSF